MSQKPVMIEDEILRSLNNMQQMIIGLDRSNCSQNVKDESKKIFNGVLDFALEQFSIVTINNLVMDEYRNKNKKAEQH